MQQRYDAKEVRANDTLANERTFLAYIRTAVAFIAFGFVIARFSLFAEEFADIVHTGVPARGLSTTFGTMMAVMGIIVALLGAWRHATTDRGLREGRVMALSGKAGYLISVIVTATGAIVAFALLKYR